MTTAQHEWKNQIEAIREKRKHRVFKTRCQALTFARKNAIPYGNIEPFDTLSYRMVKSKKPGSYGKTIKKPIVATKYKVFYY